MCRFTQQLVAILIVMLTLFAARAVAADADGSITIPRGSSVIQQSTRDVHKYPLIVRRVVQVGGIRGNLAATRTLDGRAERTVYRLPRGASAKALMKHYETTLKAAGYEVLFDCHKKSCGPHFQQVSPGKRAAATAFSNAMDSHYMVAQASAGSGDRYIAIQIAPIRGKAPVMLVNRIRVQPMQVASIRVDARQMAKRIRDKGRVALYGIYFDTDSARLRPASKPTLEQIAKLLANQPKLNLIVVGHTDSRGGFRYNIRLSRQRAGSVVDALVDDYGIDRSRLKPWGDGYTAPRATNRDTAGRARNRRVELVPR